MASVRIDQSGSVAGLRAFRFCLDPTAGQRENLARHAGAARWAFNHALAAKVTAHQQWRSAVAELVAVGIDEPVARRQVRVPVPNKPAIQRALNAVKGDSRRGIDGACPWWHEVSTYAFQSAFLDADSAWKSWLDSLTGKRVGRRIGYPRFKKRGRCRDAFRIHHDVDRPTIRLGGHRRLQIPRIGSVRLHDSARRLARLLNRRQAVVQSVTISRGAHHWYASVLVKTTIEARRPSHRQRKAGLIGVDVGVKTLAALSRPMAGVSDPAGLVANPRHLDHDTRRLSRAQRALARTQKGSGRRRRATARIARVHHRISQRRATSLHTLTKRLATEFATIAVEDLNVAGMTRSARGTNDQPGHNVKQKAGLNRRILDAAFSEIRQQLTYKTSWYGSRITLIDRWAPTSKTCSACGTQNPRLRLADRHFRCTNCALVVLTGDVGRGRVTTRRD